MPYLTPGDVPEETDCRSLLIPASSDWLAIFSGALTELTKTWNWQQEGITVDEALAVVKAVIDGYYEGCTDNCTLPGGGPIFRINPTTYLIEQLVDGEWVPPQGDYELPPTPAREEPTADERRCLAAANAVNALQILYEQLSDSYNEGQEESVALAAFVAAVIGVIGAVFGLVVAPLLVLYALIFAEVYATVEFITADLWDETFTDKLRCFFYECASDSDDVVHFDMPCIVGKIAEASEVDWGFAEIRLLLQVGGIMNMLGSQAIDAAGATTAVEIADCDDCDQPLRCHYYDFEEAEYGFEPPYPGIPSYASIWTDGEGWKPTITDFARNGFHRDFEATDIRGVVVFFEGTHGTNQPGTAVSIELYNGATQVAVMQNFNTSDDGEIRIDDISVIADRIIVGGNSNTTSGAENFTFYAIQIFWKGPEEIFDGDNCP